MSGGACRCTPAFLFFPMKIEAFHAEHTPRGEEISQNLPIGAQRVYWHIDISPKTDII